jgi:IS5 family transposase
MIKYTPANQLTLEAFKHPFEKVLDQNNRWVRLAELVPWDELAGIYARSLDPDTGRLSVDVRMVIGALIIKHKLCLSDRDTVDMISENLYMQYFCGLKSFRSEPPFDPSLFVDIRKRMGTDKFDEFNEIIIQRSESIKPRKKRIMKDKSASSSREKGKDNPGHKNSSKDVSSSSKQTNNKGKLKLDASVADQYITYPTDLKLLNKSREESERIIDSLYKAGNFDIKPRTYRRKARAAYLDIAKKRNKNKKQLRLAVGKQIRFLLRNLHIINQMLDKFAPGNFPLNKRDQRIFWVLQHILKQQKYMYDNKIHVCPDRIVNIYQLHVRPIVRGKDKTNVEFGSKINISEVDGFTRLDHLGWDNFDEGSDLKMQVERFKNHYGCYPEVVLVDKRYLTRENRGWLKERGIRIVGKPLGRPPKQKLTAYQKRKIRKENNQRNHVEGKFG